MGYLSDKLRKWQYEPWFIQVNFGNLNKKSLWALVPAALAISALLLLIIILASSSHSALPVCRTDATAEACVFPFSYKGIEYSACTTADNNGLPWCSTSLDHRGQYINGRWGNCNQDCEPGCKTVAGPQTGELCVFPFKWLGKVYRECTSLDNNGSLWCATDVDPLHNYVTDIWGHCADTCPGCRTVEGGTCTLPFVTDEGVTHEECAMDGDTDSLWCLSETKKIGGNTSLVRATCQPGCAIGCHTHSGARCVFPFIHNGTEYTECAREETVEDLEWCATMVDQQGVMVDGGWEYCHAGC